MTRKTLIALAAIAALSACSNGSFEPLLLVSEIAASPHSGTF